MVGVSHGVKVGLTELQALTWFWLVPNLMSAHEIWECHIWLPGSQRGCRWSGLGHVCRVFDLGKRSRVCFGLWLAGLGLLMATWMVRSQVDPAAKLHLVEWGHVFCLKVFLTDLVLLKDALNGVLRRYLSLDAQTRAWQRKAHLYVPSRMRAALWTLACVTTSCVGLCSCRKENTILITPCLSC